jgi:hypothetical protein
VRLVCLIIDRLYVMVLWLKKGTSETAKSVPKIEDTAVGLLQ